MKSTIATLLALSISAVPSSAWSQSYILEDDYPIYRGTTVQGNTLCQDYLGFRLTDITMSRSGRPLGVLLDTVGSNVPGTGQVSVFGRHKSTLGQLSSLPCTPRPTTPLEAYFRDLNNDGVQSSNEPTSAWKLTCDPTTSTGGPKTFFSTPGISGQTQGEVYCSPVRSWAGYIGGVNFEQARDVAVDPSGNIILVGGTKSDEKSFPITSNTTFSTGGTTIGRDGEMDAFIVKLSPSGKILWSTYFGGPNYDRAYAVEVDSDGHIYIAGRAGDGLVTTPGVVQETFKKDNAPNPWYGEQDGFIAKFSSDGKTLLWSTYFGDAGPAFIRDIDIDPEGNVYVGVTDVKGSFPHITSGTLQPKPSGGIDNVFAKLNSTGTKVLYATYLGGTKGEGEPSVRVDNSRNLFVTFSTHSPDIPTTPNAFQPTHKLGGEDLFVARLSADGKTMRSGTYLGGTGNDVTETHDLEITQNGDIVVAFPTNSQDLPTLPSSFQRDAGGNYDAFLAVLSADGTTLIGSTYLGGVAVDGTEGVAVHENSIYVGGQTLSAGLPSTPNGQQRKLSNGSDAWVAQFSDDLSELHYLSYFGGSDDDLQRSLTVDQAGRIVTTGETKSSDLPTGNNLETKFSSGDSDAFIAVIDPNL